MKNCLLLVLLLIFPAFCDAQQDSEIQTLTLAAPIADHMVLQHGKPTSVWGTAQPKSTVTVAFADQTVKASADANGQWKVTLAPLAVAAASRSLMVTDSAGGRIDVKDVLVGEVWMCSGQSNMAWTLAKVKDPIVQQAGLPSVRLFKTASKTAATVQSDCQGSWQVCTPESAAQFSAVGFHFGRELSDALDVPIGLIDTSWGGKRAEAFTSIEKLKTIRGAKPLLMAWKDRADSYNVTTAKENLAHAVEKWEQKRAQIIAETPAGKKPKLPRKPKLQVEPRLDTNYPGAIFNQKIAPWTRYAIAGTIWYQGESNSKRAAEYESLLPALIKDWRDRWGNEFPFYIVQLANYRKPSTQPGVADDWAELQSIQTKVSQTVSRSGIAVINDIGEAKNIHPPNKREVGRRLALLALKQHYGKDVKVFSSPLYKAHEIENDHMVVSFTHVGSGLQARDKGELKRFEIAGKDQKWYWAKAEIVSADSIRVSSSNVSQPVAVRYAWAANPEGANLVNSAGLPASVFRTDDWPLSTKEYTVNTNENRQLAKQMAKAGYESLINGKELDAWRNPYDHGEVEVVGHEVHLKADKKFFLVSKEPVSDFMLVADIKLPQGKANSGIMFRCHVKPNKVYGYQAECDGSDRCWSAGLYDEGRRGWVWPVKKGRSKVKVDDLAKYEKESQAFFAKPKIRNALKRNDWNRYKITCRGNKITIELNGIKVTDIEDDTDAKGFIGIQHHGEKGQTYRFRNIYLKRLD